MFIQVTHRIRRTFLTAMSVAPSCCGHHGNLSLVWLPASPSVHTSMQFHLLLYTMSSSSLIPSLHFLHPFHPLLKHHHTPSHPPCPISFIFPLLSLSSSVCARYLQTILRASCVAVFVRVKTDRRGFDFSSPLHWLLWTNWVSAINFLVLRVSWRGGGRGEKDVGILILW